MIKNTRPPTGGTTAKHRETKLQAGVVMVYVFLILLTLLFLFPMYLSLINSLNNWYSPPTVRPMALRWQNYVDATTLIDFWKYTGNSLVMAAITVVTSTLSSALAGYAFARLKAPGRNALFMIVVSTMMMPGIITQIPTYILFFKFKLLNTYLPWLFWGLGGSGFSIFLYRQFFQSIPTELEDAARIDGCSILRTYWNIFLPISLPVVATVGILTFHGSWNDVVGPFMYLKQDRYPLATALSMIGYTVQGSRQVIVQVQMAAGLLLAAPIIVTFFLGQRFIVQGIVSTGIKG